MSAVHALPTTKFIRKTTLRDTEANTNFKMLDNDVGEAITSAEADEITPLMSKIYTRLLLTPVELRESERILRFAGQEREGKWVTAWEQLRSYLRVSSETANKALRWMHEQGIIGYYSGKNGVGIRIFLNRAANSVATRRAATPQKILSFGRASSGPPRTSPAETPFNDSFAVRETLDSDINPRAPKNGADNVAVENSLSEQTPSSTSSPSHGSRLNRESPLRVTSRVEVPVGEIVLRLRQELEPALRRLAQQAAALEHERTREWLESRGLPKAARVAQREAYNVLRRHGLLTEASRTSHAEVGRGNSSLPVPHTCSDGEVTELAEACVAMLEAKGQPVERTLSEMSVAAGGFLPPEEASRVREKVDMLLGNQPPKPDGRA
jgi:hypothetical protein